jgi:hypothetical protein
LRVYIALADCLEFISRYFYWTQNVLFAQDLDPETTRVFISLRDSLIDGPVVWTYLQAHGIRGHAFDIDHAGFLFDAAEDKIVAEIGELIDLDVGFDSKEEDEVDEWWGRGIVAQGIIEEVGEKEFDWDCEVLGTGVVAQRIVDAW